MLRDDRAAAHFHALLDLLAFGVAGVDLPPHAVAAAVRALRTADAKSRLFDFGPFSERWRAVFCDRLLDALLEKRHDLLADDLAAVLFALAKPDLPGFFAAFVPAKIEALAGLDPAQKRKIRADWRPADDPPTFTAHLRDAVNDVAYNRLLNAHAME